MAVQDDTRELQLIDLFGLRKPVGAGRSGLDAILDLDGAEIPFELKSTTTGAVTTVRDFGLAHLEKWKGKHWLVGVYDSRINLEYCLYGSPTQMDAWIRLKEEYIRPDFELALHAPARLTVDDMYQILGRKETYTLQDAVRLHKKQYTAKQYREAMDVRGGYTAARMLEILRHRCQYLIARGSTLNNPHIPRSYFVDFERIVENHAARLRDLVREELQASAAATSRATA